MILLSYSTFILGTEVIFFALALIFGKHARTNLGIFGQKVR
jgi:hypothetical protein